jgi:DNA-binding transcriptional MerR regulator
MTDQRLHQETQWITIKEAAERSGFSEPTLRYYEEIGLIPPVPRGDTSGHRQYGPGEMYVVGTLACLRVAGLSVADMKQYMDGIAVGNDAAVGLVALFEGHRTRLEEQIEIFEVRKRYVDAKIALWESRRDGDAKKEETAFLDLLTAIGEVEKQVKD